MAFLRFAVSAVVIFAYAMAIGRRDILLIPRGHGKPIWFHGLLFVVQIALMNVGIDRTTAAHGVIVLNSYATSGRSPLPSQFFTRNTRPLYDGTAYLENNKRP
jgi:hypothetical protein